MKNDEEHTDEPVSKRKRRGRSRRHKRRESEELTNGDHSEGGFLYRYRVDIFAISLLAVGIFLLVERLEIKAAIYRPLMRLVQRISDIGSHVISAVIGLQKSDLVGLILMFVSVVIIVLRMRYRAIKKSEHLDHHAACPKCEGHLQRMPTKVTHRLQEFLFNVRIRRFACDKCRFRDSRWGLKK